MVKIKPRKRKLIFLVDNNLRVLRQLNNIFVVPSKLGTNLIFVIKGTRLQARIMQALNISTVSVRCIVEGGEERWGLVAV